MERREFIVSTCTLCVAAGAGMLSASLTGCATARGTVVSVRDRKVYVPRSLFAQGETQIVKPENGLFDIAVRQEADGSFLALLLRCTHADNELNFDGSRFSCSLHGSAFGLEGDVTRGPAQLPLKRLKTAASGDDVVIDLE